MSNSGETLSGNRRQRRASFPTNPAFTVGGKEVLHGLMETLKIKPHSQETWTTPVLHGYYAGAAEQLPGIISTILQPGAEPGWLKDERTHNFLIWSTVLPSQSRNLEETWRLLSTALGRARQPDISVSDEVTLRAFFLADPLVYQASIPVKSKINLNYIKFGLHRDWISEQSKMISQSELGDGLDYEKLKGNIEYFKRRFEQLSHPAIDDNEASKQLGLLGQLGKLFENGFLDFWGEYHSLASGEWLEMVGDRLEDSLTQSPYLAGLFKDGEFRDISPDLEAICWNELWRRSNQDKIWSPSDRVSYFHKQGRQFQRSFWANFYSNRLTVDQSEWILSGDRSISLLPAGAEVIKYTYLQSEDEFVRFMDTIPDLDADPKGRIRFLRRLIGVFGALKSDSPGSQNQKILGGLIERLAEKSQVPNRLQNELGVLEDQKPGVLYLNVASEAYSRFPSPTQQRNEFFTALEREGLPLVYVSSAEWSDPRTPTLPKQEESAGVEICLGERKNIPIFGEVFIISSDERLKLFEMLNKNLGQSDPDKYFNLLVSYAEKGLIDTKIPPVLLPGLLPASHNLSVLATLGILGVEQREDQVTIVVDGEKAGLKVEKGVKILIHGRMYNQELDLTGNEEEFTSPIRLLLNSALLLQRQTFIPEALTKEDISLVHKSVKAWNTYAKTMRVAELDARRLDQVVDEANSTIVIISGKAIPVSFNKGNKD